MKNAQATGQLEESVYFDSDYYKENDFVWAEGTLDKYQHIINNATDEKLKENAEKECKLIVTMKGHWWNVDVVWPEMKKAMTELGWL